MGLHSRVQRERGRGKKALSAGSSIVRFITAQGIAKRRRRRKARLGLVGRRRPVMSSSSSSPPPFSLLADPTPQIIPPGTCIRPFAWDLPSPHTWETSAVGTDEGLVSCPCPPTGRAARADARSPQMERVKKIFLPITENSFCTTIENAPPLRAPSSRRKFTTISQSKHLFFFPPYMRPISATLREWAN